MKIKKEISGHIINKFDVVPLKNRVDLGCGNHAIMSRHIFVSIRINYNKMQIVVQLGPSPNPKPKPKVWTKANTKFTLNHHHHPHKLFDQLQASQEGEIRHGSTF